MKKELFEVAAYEQPDCKILSLIAETSLMLTNSTIEDGEYDPEDIW
jgi:hypothetical protein